MSALTVVILAAGQGTRMRSRTPKALHELCGRPMVLWPVLAALEADAGTVVVVDSPTRALEPLLPDGVVLAVQGEPNGTGGAVAAAIAALVGDSAQAAGAGRGGGGEPGLDLDALLVVLSGDVPLVGAATIRELAHAHAHGGAAATMVTTELADPAAYGRVVRDADGSVGRVVETKEQGDASAQELQIHEVNAGIYAFAPRALRRALPRLRADNAQAELYLPQVLELLRADGERVAAHVVADPKVVLGVNDLVSLAHVRELAQRTIHERHMLAGVTIVDPATTVIDADVQIGPDTVIEPFTTIRGRAKLGAGCRVKHSYLVDCTLEDGASAGPFAYLRPGAVLRVGAKAGTFVEVKNSDIGAGAKVPHLAYVGDADVGERTNLGAGTITANYDGQAKHRTKIGRDVRTGVDTMLVAPVSVGDGAYTAAGSVVTKDVPPDALAVARARQTNVEGYAKRRARRTDKDRS